MAEQASRHGDITPLPTALPPACLRPSPVGSKTDNGNRRWGNQWLVSLRCLHMADAPPKQGSWWPCTGGLLPPAGNPEKHPPWQPRRPAVAPEGQEEVVGYMLQLGQGSRSSNRERVWRKAEEAPQLEARCVCHAGGPLPN